MLEEARGEAEFFAVQNAAAQDAADDVVAAVVAGHDAVGDRATDRACVVGEDAEGDVGVFLLGEAFAFRGDGAGVGLAGERGDFGEERREDVGFVVGRLGREIGKTLRRGVDAGDAFEAHAGVDVFGGERGERAVSVGVELDEDVIPDLDAARAGGVDALAAFDLVVGGQQVEMNLGARAAGTGVAHHPEIVLLVAVDDVDGGIEAFFFENGRPDVVGFLVKFSWVAFGFVGRVNGGEQALRRDAPDLGDEFPAPGEGVFFEVIAEGPVAQHLEERVVVRVEADVFEVVVFAAGADAFLGVGGAGVFGGFDAGPFGDVGGAITEEDRHELVHAGVGEKESGRIRQQGGGRDDRVALLGEEIEEALADLGGSHDGKRNDKKWWQRRERSAVAGGGFRDAR